MEKLIIDRLHLEDCTIGRANFNGFKCFSLELKWNENKTSISCIPAGIYKCQKRNTPDRGDHFIVEGVYGRTWILGHIGNFTSDIEGCILFGDSIKDINNDGVCDVTNSTVTFRALMKKLPSDFELWIGV